jgi:CDP-glucose 4,6-dehydratase
VLEPLAGYLNLAEKLMEQPNLAGAYNFGPDSHGTASVREVITLAQNKYDNLKTDVFYEDGTQGSHETATLTLDIAKARTLLGFTPRWTLSEAVHHTMAWYRAQHAGENARALCEAELIAYEEKTTRIKKNHPSAIG